MNATSDRLHAAPSAPPAQLPGSRAHPCPRPMPLVDPNPCLPYAALSSAAGDTRRGQPVRVSDARAAIGFAIDIEPEKINARWFCGLPELLAVLEEHGWDTGRQSHVIAVVTKDRLIEYVVVCFAGLRIVRGEAHPQSSAVSVRRLP
jgi:hypothetical protein